MRMEYLVWKCGDQIAMGKGNSGGPMFCEWKVTYQNRVLSSVNSKVLLT